MCLLGSLEEKRSVTILTEIWHCYNLFITLLNVDHANSFFRIILNLPRHLSLTRLIKEFKLVNICFRFYCFQLTFIAFALTQKSLKFSFLLRLLVTQKTLQWSSFFFSFFLVFLNQLFKSFFRASCQLLKYTRMTSPDFSMSYIY